MLTKLGDKIYYIAIHILENGLSPKPFYVMPSKKSNKKFLVKEGNRRTTALKLMANPKLIDSKKHASLKNRFFKLHERFMETPIRKIMCYIYDDVEEADKWVRLEHTGEQNGVGIVEWKPEQVQRFDIKHGKNKLLLQLDVGGLQLFLDGIRGFVHHQHFGVGVVQTKALPGISGGADRNAALGFFQVHAGGVGQHLRHQGDAGRAAVQGREVLHGQERCGGHLTGSRGSRGLRGGGSRRSRLAAAGAGRQDPGGRAGGKTQQKAAAGPRGLHWHLSFPAGW